MDIPNCSICLQKIKSGQMIYLLACKHLLHKICGDDWFKKKQNVLIVEDMLIIHLNRLNLK